MIESSETLNILRFYTALGEGIGVAVNESARSCVAVGVGGNAVEVDSGTRVGSVVTEGAGNSVGAVTVATTDSGDGTDV